MALNISLPQIFTKPVEHPADRYPVGSAWELDTAEGRTIAFEVLGHALYEDETLIMAIEYQRWDSVWGWIGNGRAEWLEMAIEGGDYRLYSYTDGDGIEVPAEWLHGEAQ